MLSIKAHIYKFSNLELLQLFQVKMGHLHLMHYLHLQLYLFYEHLLNSSTTHMSNNKI